MVSNDPIPPAAQVLAVTEHKLLQADGISKSFGGMRALDGVSFDLRPGEIVGLIGPNGAGKTTLVNVLTGALRPGAGRILFNGEDVTRQRPHQAARRGIARTFQIVQPLPEMSVVENVAAAALFARGLASVEEALDQAYVHLEFASLEHLADAAASSLTLPDRKRLELAKSLATNPRLLLLDEVNAGLNTGEIEGALTLVRQIANQGITILIIEHLMKVIFSLSHRILVLHHGRLIADDKPAAVAGDAAVIKAYLGEKFAARFAELESHG
jgi:branched-chain amino acid transport system ATP-binding protein